MSGAVKRSYNSTKRQEQAQATRAAIVDAALRCFTTNGYTATTIKLIAAEAAVASQTVYGIFGNKRELLRQALEAAVTGDATGVALAERPEVTALSHEPDARRRAAKDAAMVAKISPRIAPIARVVREAARVDPEFEETLAAITEQRRADMVAAARVLAGDDGLPVTLEDAVGTLYTLYSPEVYTGLTQDLGWSDRRYQRWLATILYRSLLAPSDDG